MQEIGNISMESVLLTSIPVFQSAIQAAKLVSNRLMAFSCLVEATSPEAAWEAQPDTQDEGKDSDYGGLQNLNAFGLCYCADDERENGRATASKSRGKADGADMIVRRQELGSSHNGGREKGTEEEAQEGCAYGRGNEIGNQPVQQLQCNGKRQVDGDGKFFANTTGEKP